MIHQKKLELAFFGKLVTCLFIVIFLWTPLIPSSNILQGFLFFVIGFTAVISLNVRLGVFKWMLLLFIFIITLVSYLKIPSGGGHIFSYSALLAGILIYGDSNSTIINRCFSYRSHDWLILASILSLIFINFTWSETEDVGRYASFSQEPNNDAIFLFTQLVLSSLLVGERKLIGLFLFLSLVGVIVLTGSRMLVVMVLAYFLFERFKNYSTFINVSGVLVFIVSFAGQFALVGYLSILQLSATAGNATTLIERIGSINDNSNLERVSSFLYALGEYTSSSEKMLWGSPEYRADSLPDNINFVHQWVLGMLLEFGVLYTVLFSCFMVYLVFSIRTKFKPIFYSLLLGAGILHQFVLLSPLMFVLLVSYVDQYSHNGYKSRLS